MRRLTAAATEDNRPAHLNGKARLVFVGMPVLYVGLFLFFR
jgi:hypothetical protein